MTKVGSGWACGRARDLLFTQLTVIVIALAYLDLSGYTSIGEVNNTKPNPALLVDGDTYAPAYSLKEEELERAGRQSRSV